MGRLGRFSRISGFAFPVRLLGGNQNHLSASENTVSFRNRFFLSWQILGCIYLFITHIHEREGGDIYMKSYTFLNYEVEARGLLQCVTINGHGHGRPTEPDKTKSKRNAWMEKRNARKERSTGRGGVDSQTGYTKVARLSNPGQAATGMGAPPGGGGCCGGKRNKAHCWGSQCPPAPVTTLWHRSGSQAKIGQRMKELLVLGGGDHTKSPAAWPTIKCRANPGPNRPGHSWSFAVGAEGRGGSDTQRYTVGGAT